MATLLLFLPLTAVSAVLLLLLLQSEASAPPPRTTTFSVTDYGAIGDGKRYDTPQIQAAIDGCHGAGGGSVRFPAGNYLTGTIYLRSGVVLDITENATILGGTSLNDYPLESRRWYVVFAEKATNVGIIGLGIIDGQGGKFVEKMDKRKNVMVSWNRTGACYGDKCRPRLVGFFDCRNVTVKIVILREPAYSNLQIVRCENTIIDDLIVEGDFNIPNNKGIYVEDSNNTVITNCLIDNADDAISLKSNAGPIYNLTVTASWLRTRSSAIKLESTGSSTSSAGGLFDFKSLLFDDITIPVSHRGLVLQIRDGGNVSDITFSNININTVYYTSVWWKRAEPIYVMSCPHDLKSKRGSITNLRFINISSHSENGVVLSGSSKGVLSNLKFKNVNLTYSRSRNSGDGLIDCRRGCRAGRVVCHTRAGIVMEHIDGLQIENMNMRWNKSTHLKGWNNALDFSPSTVNNISLLGFNSGLIKP